MGTKLSDFLENVQADDWFRILVRSENRNILFNGYNVDLPFDLEDRIIDNIYLEFGSEMLDITLVDE